MREIKFRAVGADDAAQIAEIYNHYVLHTDISFETEPYSPVAMSHRIAELTSVGPYIVCEEHGQIIGYAYAHPWKERAAYCHTVETTVYLRPGYERRGLGSLLMLRLIDECRKRGYHVLIACITASNLPSISLHRSLGFVEVSRFREVGRKHGGWLDVVDMQLTLQPHEK